MINDVNTILEKIKLPSIKSSINDSIIVLSSNDVKLSVEHFNEAIYYIWEHNLLKILKVERVDNYIAEVYVDITM